VSENAWGHVHVSYPRSVSTQTHIGSRYFVGQVYAIGADVNHGAAECRKYGRKTIGIWQPQISGGETDSITTALHWIMDLRVRVVAYFAVVTSLAVANLYLVASNQLPSDLANALILGVFIALFIVASFAILLLRER
jgi:hypothetical protein